MQLLRFYNITYAIVIEHDGREIEIVLPWDGCRYESIKCVAIEQHGVQLPAMTQRQWIETLERFIAQAIEDGADIGPLSRVNRIVTGRNEPQRH